MPIPAARDYAAEDADMTLRLRELFEPQLDEQGARALFAEKGYDGTSLRGVARAAGVDPALVHHYFDGKTAVFAAAM